MNISDPGKIQHEAVRGKGHAAIAAVVQRVGRPVVADTDADDGTG